MCVFCDIIAGKIPSYKVYEDDNYLAILDLAKTVKGHTLVMPKKHYPDMLAMPSAEYAALMAKVREIAADLVSKLNAEGFNILINTGERAGQSVKHLHVHILPRYAAEDGLTIEFKTQEEIDLKEVLKELKA